MFYDRRIVVFVLRFHIHLQHSLGQNAEFSELQKELDVWRKNYINVDRDREELYQQQNRGLMLRNEIDRLQAQLKVMHKAFCFVTQHL